MPNTTAVTATLTLDSSAAQPPYNVTGCSVNVQYDDGTNATLQGWGLEGLGTPKNGGAPFSLVVVDSTQQATGLRSWALTCIPRTGTSDASPFSTNQSTLTGSGPASGNGGPFNLNLPPSAQLRNSGLWDWGLMVQVVCADGTVKCFASDPEMKVGT